MHVSACLRTYETHALKDAVVLQPAAAAHASACLRTLETHALVYTAGNLHITSARVRLARNEALHDFGSTPRNKGARYPAIQLMREKEREQQNAKTKTKSLPSQLPLPLSPSPSLFHTHTHALSPSFSLHCTGIAFASSTRDEEVKKKAQGIIQHGIQSVWCKRKRSATSVLLASDLTSDLKHSSASSSSSSSLFLSLS